MVLKAWFDAKVYLPASSEVTPLPPLKTMLTDCSGCLVTASLTVPFTMVCENEVRNDATKINTNKKPFLRSPSIVFIKKIKANKGCNKSCFLKRSLNISHLLQPHRSVYYSTGKIATNKKKK